jgi:hypothetical protein
MAGCFCERLHARWLYSRLACVSGDGTGIRVRFETPVSHSTLGQLRFLERKLTSIPVIAKGKAMDRIKDISKAALGPVIACLFAAALVLCLLLGVWNLR